MDEGLLILKKVRSETIVPVLTDAHEPAQDAPVAEVVAVLRTSAFLAGQTGFIAAVAGEGEPANIKKAESIALRPFRQFAGECYGHLSCAASTGI
jgi:2-dehydro-3-deoxyphosphooctonate aldolase (KDO 8-P synthase)